MDKPFSEMTREQLEAEANRLKAQNESFWRIISGLSGSGAEIGRQLDSMYKHIAYVMKDQFGDDYYLKSKEKITTKDLLGEDE